MVRPSVFREGLLRGKTAIITGGASGIGLGISHRLAQAGANIVIASRRKDLCDTVAEDIASLHGVKTLALPLNVRDSAQVNAAFAEAREQMGSLDILVNNAAGNFYYPARTMSDNQWRAVLEIDLFGTFYCCRAACEHMKDHGGSIVSISMTLHHHGWVGMAPATAAKAGIDALTQTLALEWSPYGIRVNAIAPGPIITEGVTEAFKLGGDFANFKEAIPLGRAGQPEEIGNMVVFLSSEAGAWMTGSIVVMDGGERLSATRAGIAPGAIEGLAAMIKAGKQ
ncbi:MAG: SDR family oxidoreductase [Candidatus Hydrogenedentes bacterium]|nr:SDR family oxidoreductase [Candidatus Hydrogenedentota bacterium]